MTHYVKTPLGQLLPGNRIYEKRGKRLVSLGTVASIEKKTEQRSVTVRTDNGSWSQNWSAKVLVQR